MLLLVVATSVDAQDGKAVQPPPRPVAPPDMYHRTAGVGMATSAASSNSQSFGGTMWMSGPRPAKLAPKIAASSIQVGVQADRR